MTASGVPASWQDVLQPGGHLILDALGIEISALRPSRRRTACRYLDWTERRHHLGGTLGNELYKRLRDTNCLRTTPTRAVALTTKGQTLLRTALELDAGPPHGRR